MRWRGHVRTAYLEKNMGLDVSFNREQAVAAGLKVFTDTNGDPKDIARARAANDDPDYLAWLQREEEFICIPGTERVVHTDSGDRIIVRANKWGYVYEPLTNWLKANNIEWDEF